MAKKINWDAWGIGASLACAIHCALLPLFFTSLPLFGVNIIQNTFFEIGMLLLALVIGVWSLSHGYKKHHHSIMPLAIFFSGFAFLVMKEFFKTYEELFLIPGVLLIIVAHISNYRSCRVHHHHAHADDCKH
jgi:hypothetical protein